MHRDSAQPGYEGRSALKLSKMLVGTNVSILHNVLGLTVVTQDAAYDTVDSLVVPTHQDLKKCPLSSKHPRDHLFVRQALSLEICDRPARINAHFYKRVFRVQIGYRNPSCNLWRALRSFVVEVDKMNDRPNRAWWVLRIGLGVGPILAGLDKFFNLLTSWEMYLNPLVPKLLHVQPATFMHLVGVVEIAAGIAILSKYTRYAAYVVMVWLWCIAASLVAQWSFLDIAVRDV